MFGIKEFITQEFRKSTITAQSDCLIGVINYNQFNETLN